MKPHRMHFVLLFEGDQPPKPLYLGEDRGRAREVFNAAQSGPGTTSAEVCMYEFPLITRRARLKTGQASPATEIPTPATEAPVSEVPPPAPEDAPASGAEGAPAAPAPKTIKEKLARA